ncbi:hypothetical protein L249_3544 [Ophiocordyceps polyrhachis-furcata BCC 54312]|uniref:Uncharacterized protein n=1 Tax=Ophiocordyceps polyrhachis-furcata BCC 54312 TaxID=1330021 RepID=A0A367LM55_9HYPO|nr:hypothetical protein L249_3544 [Ophiocordyceps polyrhachis-furcata BCC 54312]
MAPRAWKGYLIGIEVIRARDIRFVNRARLSAIVDDPSIEFKARTRPEGLGGSRDAGPAAAGPRPPYVTEAVLTEDLPWPAAKTALLRYYGAFDQIRTVGFYDKLRRHEARRPKTKDTIDWLEKHAFLCTRPEGLGGSRDAGPAAAGPRPPRRLRHGYAVQRLRPYGPYGPYEGRNVGIIALKASLIRRDLGHGAYKTLEEIRPSQFSCIESCEEIINEKAAILDALYEVKYLAYEDAVALEIYNSLRLERSRDRNRTYDIAETVKKLLEANCYLIHAYLVALKHLLRYLRGTHSLGITLGGAAYSIDL